MMDTTLHRSAVAASGVDSPSRIDTAHVGRVRGNGARQAMFRRLPGPIQPETPDPHKPVSDRAVLLSEDCHPSTAVTPSHRVSSRFGRSPRPGPNLPVLRAG